MKKTQKRVISIVMTLLMVLSLIPSGVVGGIVQAYAEESKTTLIDYQHTKTLPDGVSISGTTVMASVKIHNNTDAVDCIQLKNGYTTDNLSNGNYIKLETEGGFKKGDVVTIAGFLNNSDTTKVAKAEFFTIDEDKKCTAYFTSEQFVNGNKSEADPVEESYTLEEDMDCIYIGRNGNTGTDIYTLKVERTVEGEQTQQQETRTEWNFRSGSDIMGTNGVLIQGAEGEFVQLKVNATTGKFDATRSDWAQFNTGAIVSVPVEGPSTITVVGYDTNFTVGGEAATDKTLAYEYKGAAGYVDIVATGNTYLGSIKVEKKEVLRTEWNFRSGSDIMGTNGVLIQGAEGEFVQLKVNATTGKFDATRSDWAQFNTGAIVSVPVEGPSVVTVVGYDTNFTVGGEAATDATLAYTHKGAAGYVDIVATGNTYLGSIKVEPYVAPTLPTLDTVADVWDFGAEALEGVHNNVTVDVALSVYPAGTAANTGVALSSFVAPMKDAAGNDAINFVSDKTNNRWRTTNEAIPRHDNKSLKDADGNVYTGYLYSNSSSTPNTHLLVYMNEGDKTSLMLGSNGNAAEYAVLDPDGEECMRFNYSAKSQLEKATVYAAKTGWYKIYCTNEKLVVARITREHAPVVTVSGSVSAPETIPAGYALIFKNTISGGKTEAAVNNGSYSTLIFGGYTYEVALKDANGYVVKAGTPVEIAAEDKTQDIEIGQVDLVTITGSVTGIAAEALAKMKLEFIVPEGKVYIPELKVDAAAGTYSLVVENGVEYAVTAVDVNDYELKTTTISATEAKTEAIAFEAKPVYDVTVEVTGVEDASNAVVTFTNVNEEGYVYTFKASEGMKLRNGSYSVKVAGLGNYAVKQGTTPNVNVNGAAASTTAPFEPLTSWDFAVLNNATTVETVGEAQYYAGLALAGPVMTNKTYLLSNADGAITIPALAKGDKVTIKYCYSASFTVADKTVDEKSGSTGTIDSIDVLVTEDGPLTITTIAGTNASQTYFCAFEVLKAADVVDYKDTLTVGTDKEFKTINEALAVIRKMARTEDQAVTVMIDPGNYEEMLVIDMPNVTLKNASATPSIELKNKGVDIDENAVRITWYYGHGYTYYSMGSDCKYDPAVLAANKSNGYPSFVNPGSGTTNGSYWNATVVVFASNFNAEGIIFENSFNQYMSAKAAEDIIVKQSGAKEGTVTRSSMKAGDTKVQEKEYVERAAALAIGNNVSKSYFNNCKFISRQDTLYGGTGSTVAFDKCSIYGGTDYIFGGMVAVFNKCDLVFNTNDQTSKGEKDDIGYITAAQQSTGRGYLMYECHVTSTTPGVDTASTYTSKPGDFGRPWQAKTSEVVFYNTVIDAADAHWGENLSLIRPAGWNSGLSGESPLCVEYGTVEKAGVDNSASRVSWASVLSEAVLADGTPITIEAFLGDWKPFKEEDIKPVKSGLVQDEDGAWRYYVDGEFVAYNGFVENEFGWWCVAGGQVAFEYTGLWNDQNVGWWYVENGMINFAYNGLIFYSDAWWCVAGGRVAFEYTGLWNDQNVGWWYVENGMINFAYNGLIFYNDAWWCVCNGAVIFDYTGLWNDQNVGWWYVENGMVNFAYNGLIFYNDAWWCVAGGRVAFEYTGLWNDQNVGWWYVENGMINFAFTGVTTFEGNQYNVVNGCLA